jgi:hypothetical protein
MHEEAAAQEHNHLSETLAEAKWVTARRTLFPWT